MNANGAELIRIELHLELPDNELVILGANKDQYGQQRCPEDRA